MSMFRILLLNSTRNAMRVRLTPKSLLFESGGGTRTLDIECGGSWRLSLSRTATDSKNRTQLTTLKS